MSEEITRFGSQSEEGRQYKDQINYPNLLMQRMSRILFYIDNNYDPQVEIESLIAVLLPDVRQELKEPLAEIAQKRTKQLQKLHKLGGWMEKRDIYGRHINKFLQEQEIIKNTSLEMVEVIVKELDRKNLIIKRDNFIERGGI